MSETTTMLRVSQVAERLGISDRTIRKWIKDGKVRAYRAGEGCMWLIQEDDVDKIIRPNISPDTNQYSNDKEIADQA
jgi:excisionase family DNA binding protein